MFRLLAWGLLLSLTGVVSATTLWEDFQNPPQETKAWTYWFWSNSLTDKETIQAEAEDIAQLGFGGVLLTDSRGYWDDADHVINPPATIRWGSDEWRELIATAIRACAKHNLKMSINIAASGGHLRGDCDAGEDNPKFLMCRNYLPGDAFEEPELPHYHEVALFAVKTAEPAERSAWAHAGDGYYSMAATGGKRADGEKGLEMRGALSVRELDSAAEGKDLGPNWTIVRLGYATTRGQENDIDVLDETAVTRHLERVFTPLFARIPGLVGTNKTLANLYNVSWEGAMPTWSVTFARDFKAVTGYDLRPYLPVLAGYKLKGDHSEAFMYDFRRARGMMMCKHLYGTVQRWAHTHGMGACSESGGPWVRTPQTFGMCDQLAFLARNDVPQGEFWPIYENGTREGICGHANANGRFITKGVVSAAHVYGMKIASAEAFTHMHRHWSVDPAFLKPIGDQAFADGINRLVWHTYTTAPEKYGTPGIEYFAGSHINRHVTWHKDFPPMVSALNRCQALLQRGEPVTDIAVLCGDHPYCGWGRFREVVSEEINVKIPSGYLCDLVNDEALEKNPGLLSKYALVYDARKKENIGKPIPVGSLKPDIETTENYTGCHRKDGQNDYYFMAGEGPASILFRATAPQVEIWDPVAGTRTRADAKRIDDTRTLVSLNLPIGGSAFVVFLRDDVLSAAPQKGTEEAKMPLQGPWRVKFAYSSGIAAKPPQAIVLNDLADFTSREDLKHFSGTAIYRTSFRVSKLEKGMWLSLGCVPTGLAHVWLNGIDCGVAWCAPWSVDVAKAIQKGTNTVEIRYTNNWYNRLVGDCLLPEDERITQSVLRYWKVPRKGEDWRAKPTLYSGFSSYDPLQKSGLLGPIELIFSR